MLKEQLEQIKGKINKIRTSLKYGNKDLEGRK